MGVFTDYLASSKMISNADDAKGTDRIAKVQINRVKDLTGDPGYITAMTARDEVQSIAVFDGTVTGGNFTLAFTLWGGETFTTAAIAYNANAATIETAIDTAANGNVTGWTDGDISVSGGDFGANAVVVTFDGDSVTNAKHSTIVVDSTNLTGGGTAGAVSVTVNGQANRRAWSVMHQCGIVTGTPPVQGAATGWTVNAYPNNRPFRPSADVVKLLAMDAALEDGNKAIYAALLEDLNIN